MITNTETDEINQEVGFEDQVAKQARSKTVMGYFQSVDLICW